MKYSYINSEVFEKLKAENTKIAQKALNEIDEERVFNITVNRGVFWIECNKFNHPTDTVYKYLISYIKRKFNLQYLHELTWGEDNEKS